MFSYLNMTVVDLFIYLSIHSFLNGMSTSFNMHSFSELKRTGCVVIGWAWEGVAIWHTGLTNPVRPWRAAAPSSGRLPGKLQAADKKEEQHLAFCVGGGKGGSGESELSDLFRCKQFCSAFSFEFSFVILAKFCHYWHNHYYFHLFKIRSQYTRFSLFFFFSLIDYVQKCKEVNLYRLSPPDFRALPLLLAVANANASKIKKQNKQNKQKWSNMQLCFPTWPNFQGEYKYPNNISYLKWIQ